MAAAYRTPTGPRLYADLLAIRDEKLRKDLYDMLLMTVNCCPMCRQAFGGGVISRSSHRSVTMRCGVCGLQWTMTAHRIAAAARRHAERNPDGEYAQICANIAARF